MGKREAGERTFVHRIVLYDLLKVNEKRKTYECEECGERIQRTKGDPSRPCRSCNSKRFSEVVIDSQQVQPHISIPLSPGLESVWAPNGYGKTFAMKILEKLRFPDPHSDEKMGKQQYWLGRFLDEARREVIEPSDQMSRSVYLSKNPVDAEVFTTRRWRNSENPNMIPFSQMMVRFVTLDQSDSLVNVEDLWIKADQWMVGFDGEDPVDHCSLVLHDYATMCETIPETVASMPMDRELFHMLKSLVDQGRVQNPHFMGLGERGFPDLSEVTFIPSIIPERPPDHGQQNTDWPWSEILHLDPMSMDTDESVSVDFSLTRHWELLDTLSKTRIQYVEVPKECHGSGSDPLQGCQELIASIIRVGMKLDKVPNSSHLRSEILDRFAELHYKAEKLEDEMTAAFHHPKSSLTEQEATEEAIRVLSERSSMITKELEHLQEIMRVDGRRVGQIPILTNELVQSVFDRINDSIMTSEDDPWARRISPLSTRSREQRLSNPMRFERPIYTDYVDPKTLSFGQRSAIVLECWLGYLTFMEMMDSWDSEYKNMTQRGPDIGRICLVIDEPESGRSEHSVDSLSERVLQMQGLIGPETDNSLIIMSHRRDVLESVGNDGRFHLMQQFDDSQLGLGEVPSTHSEE